MLLRFLTALTDRSRGFECVGRCRNIKRSRSRSCGLSFAVVVGSFLFFSNRLPDRACHEGHKVTCCSILKSGVGNTVLLGVSHAHSCRCPRLRVICIMSEGGNMLLYPLIQELPCNFSHVTSRVRLRAKNQRS